MWPVCLFIVDLYGKPSSPSAFSEVQGSISLRRQVARTEVVMEVGTVMSGQFVTWIRKVLPLLLKLWCRVPTSWRCGARSGSCVRSCARSDSGLGRLEVCGKIPSLLCQNTQRALLSL